MGVNHLRRSVSGFFNGFSHSAVEATEHTNQDRGDYIAKLWRYYVLLMFFICRPQEERSARRPVSRVLSPLSQEMTIPLGRPLPDASRDLPGRRPENLPGRFLRPACRPYSVLLPVGFAVPPPLPGARCALTAPFHPYPPSHVACARASAGGLLSVALSLGSPPPGVARHRVSVEPGLSSRPGGVPPGRAVIQPSGGIGCRAGGGARQSPWRRPSISNRIAKDRKLTKRWKRV